MKRLQHLIEYIALNGFAVVIRLFPLSFARRAAKQLGNFVYWCIPIRKQLVLESLALGFPEKDSKELHAIARGVYRQFALTMMELLFFPKFTSADIGNMVDMSGLDVLQAARTGGKGAVIVGAHFGNWELMGAAVARVYPLTFVVGQQQNSQVDDLLNAYRTAKGVKLIPLKLALRGVMKTLRNNEFIGILADQDAHEQGAFVPFFGRPASTPKGPALFALRAGAPLIMATMFRSGNKFKAVFETVPRPAPSGNEENDIQTYTAAFTAILERNTRISPDHWFWLHRRWKTKLIGGNHHAEKSVAVRA
ncbi:MAG: lysophospholipid acyltransferase family protein [Elusimicrobia bacterium]|nr:lysophospholipid acyltransferase family protein [Elusimicrobiota bacterium]